LLPNETHNFPSITRYLGIKDWYSWSYLSVCSGHYALSKEDPALLSTSVSDITCSNQKLGYTFSLGDILRENIDATAEGILDRLPDNLTSKNYETQNWAGLWIISIVTAFFNFFLIPFAWSGKHRINLYIAFISLVCAVHPFTITRTKIP
jgi:hypothetical protein